MTLFDDLAGKTAVVTGAAGGIGEVYAQALFSSGARVALVDIDAEGTETVASRLDYSAHKAIGVAADISDESQVRRMADMVSEKFGGIDILVNNAALHLGEWSHGVSLSIEKWRRILDVNVVGQLSCSLACRPYMASGGGGSIINQSSLAAYHGAAGAYSVSKLALNGLTMVLARELAEDMIRVNGIAPGFIASPTAVERVDPTNRQRARSAQVLEHEGSMDDLVGTLLYLASDASRFVTGQTISVDGGAARRV